MALVISQTSQREDPPKKKFFQLRLQTIKKGNPQRKTHRHTDTQTHRHTDTQTHRHTDTQTHRHTDTQTHRHTDTQTHRHTDTQTHRHTDTQTHRHTDTQTHTPNQFQPSLCLWLGVGSTSLRNVQRMPRPPVAMSKMGEPPLW